MLCVGLTGSIAVGKSHVSSVLAELGCHVIDADQVARQVVEPGAEGLRAVVDAFGPGVLREDGTLDRARLREVILTDPRQRELLNSILHPLIIEAQDEQLRRWRTEDPAGVAVVDAALMIESGSYRRFDKIIVVHCDPEVQAQRLMARDRIERAEAERRIAAQMPQEEKKRYADYLIDTTRGFDDARRQTEEVHAHLRELARAESGEDG